MRAIALTSLFLPRNFVFCATLAGFLPCCSQGGIRDATTGPEASPSAEVQTNSPQTNGAGNKLCKRGMVIGSEVQPALSEADLVAVSKGVSWWYNYQLTPSTDELSAASKGLGVEFVPMVFTGSSLNASSIIIDANAGYLLAFNEPNFTAQGDLTPQAAAAAWPKVEALADQHNLLIVGPALNYCGGGCNETSPIAWLDAFFSACPNCRVDHLAIHSYVCFASALQSAYLAPFEAYKKPLWVTEFSCLDGSADAASLASQQNAMISEVTMMEQNPNVFRYAWFIGRSNTSSPPISLLDGNNKLTELGQLYTSLPQTCQEK